MNREEFMELVYSELHDDGTNFDAKCHIVVSSSGKSVRTWRRELERQHCIPFVETG